MTDDPIDLSSIDPTADTARFNQIVASTLDQVTGQLANRRARNGIVGQLGLRLRPMLAAAAVIALIAAGTLLREPASTTTVATADAPTDIAEAMGVPGPLASWVASEELPPATELLGATERTR